MTPEERDELLDLVAAAALGVLPATEQARVAAFLRSDPEARREYEELRPAADAVGLSAAAAIEPARAARMKAAVMAGVLPLGRARRATAGLALAAAAALGFGIVSGLQNAALRDQLAADRQAAADREARVAADLAAPDAVRRTNAYGAVITRGRRAYLVLKLPPLPAGRVYEAWTVPAGTKTLAPSVTFRPAAGTTFVALPEDATKISAIGINVEPEGGSATPTTPSTFVQPLT